MPNTRDEVRRKLLLALCTDHGHVTLACRSCNRRTDVVLATYDIPGLLDDLSVLNAENHRLLDLVDAAMPHNMAGAPHRPTSLMKCARCATS